MSSHRDITWSVECHGTPTGFTIQREGFDKVIKGAEDNVRILVEFASFSFKNFSSSKRLNVK